MKRYFLILAICAVSLPVQAQTRIDAGIEVDSVMREFIVAVPSGSIPASGYPLVFMFHGTSQNGELFYNESQWKEKGEAETFITVFPTALRYCIMEDSAQRITTKWHNGEGEELACPGTVMKNDVHFVNAMLDSIRSRFPIDNSRIYVSGFSNGMGFASKLAVEMGNVFAAVAGCGSMLSNRDSADAKRNIPVWTVIGTLDDKFLKGYEQLGITEFPFNDTTLALMSRAIRRFLGSFNLTEDHTRSESGRTITYRFATPASSEATSEFRFTLVNNMFHVYPNGSNNNLVAADIFWDFFAQFTTPTSIAATPGAPLRLVLHPQPSRNTATVEFTLPRFASVRIEVYSLLGAKLETLLDAERDAGTHRLLWSNASFAAGTYLLRLQAAGDVTSTLVPVTR